MACDGAGRDSDEVGWADGEKQGCVGRSVCATAEEDERKEKNQ